MSATSFFKNFNRILAIFNTVLFGLSLPFSIIVIITCVRTHEPANAAGMLIVASLFFLLMMAIFWMLTAVFSHAEKKQAPPSEE